MVFRIVDNYPNILFGVSLEAIRLCQYCCHLCMISSFVVSLTPLLSFIVRLWGWKVLYGLTEFACASISWHIDLLCVSSSVLKALSGTLIRLLYCCMSCFHLPFYFMTIFNQLSCWCFFKQSFFSLMFIDEVTVFIIFFTSIPQFVGIHLISFFFLYILYST